LNAGSSGADGGNSHSVRRASTRLSLEMPRVPTAHQVNKKALEDSRVSSRALLTSDSVEEYLIFALVGEPAKHDGLRVYVVVARAAVVSHIPASTLAAGQFLAHTLDA